MGHLGKKRYKNTRTNSTKRGFTNGTQREIRSGQNWGATKGDYKHGWRRVNSTGPDMVNHFHRVNGQRGLEKKYTMRLTDMRKGTGSTHGMRGPCKGKPCLTVGETEASLCGGTVPHPTVGNHCFQRGRVMK